MKADMSPQLRADLIQHWMARERALGPVAYECPSGLEDIKDLSLIDQSMQLLYHEVCCRLRDLLQGSRLVAQCLKGGRVEKVVPVPRPGGWALKVPAFSPGLLAGFTEPTAETLGTIIHRYEWTGRRTYDPATDTEVREYVYRGLER
jgi:hypothetical protein